MNLAHHVPDFDQPIEALVHCHRKILVRMDQLDVLAAQLLDEGAPAFSHQMPVWREIIGFIQGPMAQHTLDEEQGLFPILDGRGGEIVDRMSFEHRWIAQTEEQMIARFDTLASGAQPVTSTAVGELALLARKVTSHHRSHIQHEDEKLFPVAANILGVSELRALGDLMRRHRSSDERTPALRATAQ